MHTTILGGYFIPGRAGIDGVVNAASGGNSVLLKPKVESKIAGRGCYHQIGVGGAERDLAEPDPEKELATGRLLNLRPGGAPVGGAQNSHAIVGIARTVGLAGSDQNDVAVSGLERDRAHGERGLVIDQR